MHLPAKLASAPTLSAKDLTTRVETLHRALIPDPVHPLRFSVPHSRAVEISERRQLSGAANRLRMRLEPCQDDLLIEAIVSQFLIGFELGKGTSALNTAALNERYVKALRGVPVEAIQAAADRYDGVEGAKPYLPWNPEFRPNHAQFAAEAREGVVRLRAQLRRIEQILEAEVVGGPEEIPEAKRAECVADAQALIEAIKATNVVDTSDPRDAMREANQRFQEREAAVLSQHGIEVPRLGGMRLSAELADRLGMLDVDVDDGVPPAPEQFGG